MKRWLLSNWEFFSIAIVVIAGIIIRCYIVFQDMDYLVAGFLPDDAFYYFVISRNIMHGRGISFDGIHPTNGFHPLWLFLITPLFQFEGETPIRVLLLISVAMDVVAAVLIYRLLRNLLKRNSLIILPAFLVLCAWIFSPYIVRQSVNGLETSLNNLLFVIAIFLTLREQFKTPDLPRNYIVPLTWGLVLLSRTDNIIFWIFAIFALRLGTSQWQGKYLLVLLGIPTIVVVPWVVWNYSTFGTLMQSSGVAIPQFIQMKYFGELTPSPQIDATLRHIGNLLINGFERFLSFGGFSLRSLSITTALCLVPILLTPDIAKQVKKALSQILYLLLGTGSWFLIHNGFRWMTRDWYFVPLVFILWILISILFAGAYSAFRLRKQLTGSVLFGALLVWQMYPAASNMWIQLSSSSWGYPWQREMLQGATWLRMNVSADERIGALNAGLLSYFSGKDVINLDGVVNNQVLPFVRDREICDYVENTKISLIADFENSIESWAYFWNHGAPPPLSLESIWYGSVGDNRYGVYKFLGHCEQPSLK